MAFDNWSNRQRWNTDSSNVNGTSTNFGLHIRFDITDSELANNAQSDGDDILFTESDGSTQVPHEIEHYDSSTGNLVAHVLLDTDEQSDTTFYLYFGNSSASNQEDIDNTWADGVYNRVYHYAESSGTPLDSATVTNAGTLNGGYTQGVTGQIYNGIQFNGTDGYHDTAFSDSAGDYTSAFSGSIWFNTNDASVKQPLVHKDGAFSVYVNQFDIRFEYTDDTGSTIIASSSSDLLSSNTWHMVTFSFSVFDDELKVAVDGTLVDTVTATELLTDNSNNVLIGHDASTEYFDGEIDEFRIQEQSTADDDILDEYSSQTNNLIYKTPSVTASQPSALATMNDTLVTTSARQVLSTATVNTGVASLSLNSSNVSSPATMNDAVVSVSTGATLISASSTMSTTSLTNELSATQADALSEVNSTSSESRLYDWIITDADGETFRADSLRLDDGKPQFRRGRETTRTFVFGKNDHTNRYERITEKYKKYQTENTVKTETTYNGLPHYTENINSISDASSYLWKLEPNPNLSSEAWWVVVTNIEEQSRMVGANEALGVRMFTIAPVSEGDRNYITENFKV